MERVLALAVLLSGCNHVEEADVVRTDQEVTTVPPAAPVVSEAAETVLYSVPPPPPPAPSEAVPSTPVAGETGIGETPPASGPTRAPGPKGFAGTVVETMRAGPYTYLQVDTGDEKSWVAAPKLELRVGDSVVVPSGMKMSNFHSRSLNRTFDTIYFAGTVSVAGKTPASSTVAGRLPAGHPALPGAETKEPRLPAGHVPIPGAGAGAESRLPQGHPAVTGQGAPAPKIDLAGIEKAEGGKTVAEVFAASKELAGKEVLLRGKVVKFNAGILSRNWLHVQDGSGAAGTNDLTVTTKFPVKVGDTVLLRGTLSLDRDFGAGYKYAVIVEDATLTVE